MKYMKRPCPECPYRRDTIPGQFSRERYEQLRSTIGTDEDMRAPGEPFFACHKSTEGKDVACAGWLATHGDKHVTVRLAIALGYLPPEMTAPQESWPELYNDYDEMVEMQAGEDY